MSPAPTDSAFRLHVLVGALTNKGLWVASSAEPAQRGPLEDLLPIHDRVSQP